jgi:hypothetical protein
MWPWAGWGPQGVTPTGTGVSGEQELEMLRNQAAYFEEALQGLKRRIEELEAGARED